MPRVIKFIDTEHRIEVMVTWGWEKENGALLFNEHGDSVGGDEKILSLDAVKVVQQYECLRTVHFKVVK